MVLSLHSSLRGAKPPFYEDPSYVAFPLFWNFVQPHPLPCLLQPHSHCSSVVLFLWQNEWSRHTWCAILLNDNTDLHMSSLGTLVPEGPWCVFYVTRRQVYWGLTHNVVFTGTLIWYHIHTNTHSTPRGQ